ncbi:MAG: SAM-dependent methyltransferase, partial [Alphaproteobacteria bacterium]
QYSCAYFDSPESTLEEAQLAKKRHLAAKLLFDRPGLKTLDIGSGWGGLGLYLNQEAGAEVTGVTLSTEQQKFAEARTKKLGVEDQVRFLLRDYREEKGPYDRIVSVGMFEHVGITHYREFFRQLKSLLKEDGIAVIHFIARWDGP